jgi:hypothetical protein
MSEEKDDEKEPEIKIIQAKPVSPETKLLREAYWADKTGQADLMDSLAKELIRLELAIPGIYATILKFLSGGDATADNSQPNRLYAIFGLWGLSLILSFLSLYPLWWQVDTAKIKGKAGERPKIGAWLKHKSLSLEDYFFVVARYKRWLLALSALSFFAGLFFAASLSFQ